MGELNKETLSIIRAWADGSVIQWRVSKCDKWQQLPLAADGRDVSFDERIQYRIQPSVRRIGERDVPTPEVKAPKNGDTYFVVDTNSPHDPPDYFWVGDDWDKRQLSNGMVHLDAGRAREHAEALIAVSLGVP